MFDYRDLARLSAYFHLADAGEDGARIETSSQRKRQAILQAAWDSQRRRLLAVVPAMTRLIKHLSPNPMEKEPVQEEVSIWKRPITIGKASPPGDAANGAGVRAVENPAKAAEDDADAWRFTQGPERELFSSRAGEP